MGKKTAVASAPMLDRDYQAEDDFRTLQRADEVRRDSKRHTAAKRHGRKQLSSIRRVIGGSR